MVEEDNHDDDANPSTAESGKTKRTGKTLVRGKLGYENKFGSVILTPTAGYDFFRTSTTIVWGASIGFGF